jgi:hypothetical protein
MIDYRTDRLCNTTRLMGSVLPRALPQAFVSFIVALGVVAIARTRAKQAEDLTWKGQLSTSELFYPDEFESEVILPVLTNPYIHQIAMLSISFVLAFRCNIAYNRYWEAASSLFTMRHEWSSALSLLVAFDMPENPKDEDAVADARAWRQLVAHLLSLLHGVVVLEIKRLRRPAILVAHMPPVPKGSARAQVAALCPCLRGLLVPSDQRQRELQIEVIGGLLPEEKAWLESCPDRSGWMQYVTARLYRLLVTRMRNGGLDVPAPICAKVFQTIEAGVGAATDAQRIAHTPFPYPFYELMRWMKW